jgi:hypothetical protein
MLPRPMVRHRAKARPKAAIRHLVGFHRRLVASRRLPVASRQPPVAILAPAPCTAAILVTVPCTAILVTVLRATVHPRPHPRPGGATS